MARVRAPRAEDAFDDRFDTDPPAGRRRRTGRWIALAVGVILFVALADFVYVAVGLASSLRDAERGLDAAKAALEDGNVAEARIQVDAARDAVDESVGLTGHPSISALGAIPWVGNDADSADRLAQAARWAVVAADRIVEAAEVAKVNPEHFLSGIYRGGRLDLVTVEQATPFIAEADSALERARALLRAEPRGFLPQIKDAVTDARATVDDARETIHKGSVLLGVLPDLLGAKEPRSYLLAFQALNEARGTGGVIGYFGVLRAERGRLALEDVRPAANFTGALDDPVDAPSWFKKNYGPQEADLQASQSNLTPNFPVSASVLLEIYEAVTGTHLDGVFEMDAVALKHLLPATGPITARSTGLRITAKNAERVVMRDSYLNFSEGARQNRFLAEVISGFWRKIRDGEFKSVPLASGLSEAVRTGHVKVFTSDVAAEESLAQLGAGGDYFSSGPGVQLVFHENIAPNKVDYYLRRRVSTEIELGASGIATVHTTIEMDNTAPAEPKSVLLGDGKKFPVGTNVMLLNVLRPKRSVLDGFAVEGVKTVPGRIADTGYPVTWYVVEIPPGHSKTVTLTYRTPMRVVDADTAELDLTFYPQTSVVPDDLSVVVRSPSGFTIDSAAGLELDAGGARASGSGPLDEPRSIRVRFSRSG